MVSSLLAFRGYLDQGIPGCHGDTGGGRGLPRVHVMEIVDHGVVQQHLGVGVEHLDEHVGPELLQVVQAHEYGEHLLDGVVDGRLVEEQAPYDCPHELTETDWLSSWPTKALGLMRA